TWVSNGAVGFLATSAKSIGPIDAQALLYPILRPYLQCDISVISEQKLLDFKQKPVVSCGLCILTPRFLEEFMMRQLHGLPRLSGQITGNHSKISRMLMSQQVLFVEAEIVVL